MIESIVVPEGKFNKEKPETTYYTGILYHGAKQPFDFDPGYDFNDQNTEGSATLGAGLYLTDNGLQAKNYSEVRQVRGAEDMFVYSVYTPECRFLDFRGEQGNIPVENVMISKWADYFNRHLDEEKNQKPDLGQEYVYIQDEVSGVRRKKINLELKRRQEKEKYLGYIRSLAKEEDVNLRVMLATAPPRVQKANLRFRNYPYPPWAQLFRRFVAEELEYDGIIYDEGGEGEKRGEAHTSFVVFDINMFFSLKSGCNLKVLS